MFSKFSNYQPLPKTYLVVVDRPGEVLAPHYLETQFFPESGSAARVGEVGLVSAAQWPVEVVQRWVL